MSMTHDEAAQAMGMPVHEILAVATVPTQDGDCHVVTTHDGIHTLVDPDGSTRPYTGPDPAAAADHDVDQADGQHDKEDGQGDGADVPPAGGAPVVDPAAGGQGDGPAVDVDGDGVPDGTTAQVLEWVGTDAQRAAAALAAEQGKPSPRTGLVAPLQKLVQP